MVKADHKYKAWAGAEVPFWERRRFVLDQAAREKRAKEIKAMQKHLRSIGKRPPLTTEQKKCGARRLI